ncbi:MAG: di-trans,poly-cis-decaprenylcistransferase [Candidatus Vogelbacteria bacterium]|nr:di-trans,poly-cis-decaprenylcistransferase [Candidatus Vogelbacteria bacterium]
MIVGHVLFLHKNMAENQNETKQPKSPRCIGIIMDGNRRWAKDNGLETWQGHDAGAKKLREVTAWAIEAGVTHLIVYTFSTENWNRPESEINFLMQKLAGSVESEMPWLIEHGVKMKLVGDKNRFEPKVKDSLTLIEARTASHNKITLALALNYGGRDEILRAINKCILNRKDLLAPVTESEFTAALDTAGMPDPDMIIRTSGEQRLSGFLPWQSVYSELFFPSINWPGMTREIFFGLLEEYNRRQRRFGA